MADKIDVWQGTLALMVLRTLEVLGAQHGYGIARRIEETSRGKLTLNYGTLYPALLKLEQEGFIKGEWGESENNRRAKFYRLTAAGKKQLASSSRPSSRPGRRAHEDSQSAPGADSRHVCRSERRRRDARRVREPSRDARR